MDRIDSFSGAYGFLSNFWPSPIVVDGIAFATVEHAFQAAKSTEPAVREAIARLPTPGKAKRAGRRVVLRPDWHEIRVDAMRWLLARKFEAGSPLAGRLLETGAALLVEGNTWGDRFWGVCDGRGENWLGVLLMARREELGGACAPSRPAQQSVGLW